MNTLTSGLLMGIIGAIFLYMAFRLHFFRVKILPKEAVRLRYPLIGIVGYLFFFFVGGPLSIFLMGKRFNELAIHSPALLMTLLQVASMMWVVFYLLILSFLQDRSSLHALWIHPKRSHFTCILEDFGLGILTWIIAFPTVAAISQIMEFITFVLTGISPVEQIAVRYLKMAKESPFLLSIALITILIIAPIVEEFVFRGFLYTYLRKKFSMKKAIILSSLIFALFHFSFAQGVSNIPLLSSLFILALFLSFLYERQQSLFAPIALHMTFNSISVIRILLISN